MTKQQQQYYLLGGLGLVLVLVFFWNRNSTPTFSGGVVADERYQPLKVDDPSLRLDLLEKIHNTEYAGSHRNIFTGEAPPPPPSEVKKMQEEAARRQVPTGPPPLTVPAKFYGYATDPRTGERRAFFTASDDVFVVSQGGILLNNFRITKINNNSVEVQEISSGRSTSLALDASAAPGGMPSGPLGGPGAIGGGLPQRMPMPGGQPAPAQNVPGGDESPMEPDQPPQ